MNFAKDFFIKNKLIVFRQSNKTRWPYKNSHYLHGLDNWLNVISLMLKQ